MRLKGAGWLAAFPAPNISTAVASDPVVGEPESLPMPSESTEEFERAANDAPSRFDFLGKGSDTGFRIVKNASEDRFATLVRLVYVLACPATKKKFPHSFGYHGRETLTGVIDGAPYPVMSVDIERSEIKSKLKSREAALTGEPPRNGGDVIASHWHPAVPVRSDGLTRLSLPPDPATFPA